MDFQYDEDRSEMWNLTRIAFYGIVEMLNVLLLSDLLERNVSISASSFYTGLILTGLPAEFNYINKQRKRN